MHLVEIRQELWAGRALYRQLLLHLESPSLLLSVEKYVGLGGLLIGCFLSLLPTQKTEQIGGGRLIASW